MATLKANVWVDGQLYRAGSTPPPAAAARIRNPKVWEGDPPSAPEGDAEQDVGGPDESAAETVQEPPRGGAGSGVDAWRAFLGEQGVEELPADANRDDLVALWDARKLQG
jgi:hypothetical protein